MHFLLVCIDFSEYVSVRLDTAVLQLPKQLAAHAPGKPSNSK